MGVNILEYVLSENRCVEITVLYKQLVCTVRCHKFIIED
jgi:hypothetical protein